MSEFVRASLAQCGNRTRQAAFQQLLYYRLLLRTNDNNCATGGGRFGPINAVAQTSANVSVVALGVVERPELRIVRGTSSTALCANIRPTRPATRCDASRRNSRFGRFASSSQHNGLCEKMLCSRDAKRPKSAFPREAWERGQGFLGFAPRESGRECRWSAKLAGLAWGARVNIARQAFVFPHPIRRPIARRNGCASKDTQRHRIARTEESQGKTELGDEDSNLD